MNQLLMTQISSSVYWLNMLRILHFVICENVSILLYNTGALLPCFRYMYEIWSYFQHVKDTLLRAITMAIKKPLKEVVASVC